MNKILLVYAIRVFAIVILTTVAACEQKKDAVLTPQQEEEYARMMRNAPRKSYDDLQDENTRLRLKLEDKATNL